MTGTGPLPPSWRDGAPVDPESPWVRRADRFEPSPSQPSPSQQSQPEAPGHGRTEPSSGPPRPEAPGYGRAEPPDLFTPRTDRPSPSPGEPGQLPRRRGPASPAYGAIPTSPAEPTTVPARIPLRRGSSAPPESFARVSGAGGPPPGPPTGPAQPTADRVAVDRVAVDRVVADRVAVDRVAADRAAYRASADRPAAANPAPAASRTIVAPHAHSPPAHNPPAHNPPAHNPPARSRQDPGQPAPGQPGPVGQSQGALSLGLGLGRGSRERGLVRRVGLPLPGTRKVVVLSIKGGVGKTTTVAVTGSMLAALRRDRVVALDASSDWGTLAARLSVVPRQSVREMAARGRHAVSEGGVLAQLTASPSGLLVVGSDPQSAVSGALTQDEYVETMRLLDYVAGVILTDVGAGLQQPFLSAALHTCDQLVVASAATWDAAQSAGVALDWLAARGLGALVERSLVVLNNLYPARRRRQGFIRDIKADLDRRSRAVHEIPFDPALQPGGRILLRKLGGPTRHAFLEFAADIVSGLASAPPR